MGKRKNLENFIFVNLLFYVLVRVMFFFFYGYDFDYYNDGDDSDDFQGYYDVDSVVMLFLREGVIC